MELIILENELSYEGVFVKPSFALWGESKTLFRGLYDTFEGFGTRLADLTVDSPGDQPTAQAVRVGIPSHGLFSFKFDRVEFRGNAVTDKQLHQWPAVLERGVGWVRSAGQVSFASHLVIYTAHGSVSGGTATDALNHLPARPLSSATNLPSGVIAHFQIPALDAQAHLTVDHSVRVPNGIYLHFIVFLRRDQISYPELLGQTRSALEQCLASLDLVLPKEAA